MLQGWKNYNDAVPGDPVAWIEKNLPPGSTIYWTDGFRLPLPTAQSAERLWAETSGADAWRIKFHYASRRLSLGEDPPRAMTEDPMQLERSHRRRWFILGAAVDKAATLRHSACGRRLALLHSL